MMVYGQAAIQTEVGAALSASRVGNRYRFTGREYDAESGLYYYRARMYAPRLGRFLQTDPIGYADGINWYAYCGNNPVILLDPWGLCGTISAWEGPSLWQRVDAFLEDYTNWGATKYYYDNGSGELHGLLDVVGTGFDPADWINGGLYFLEGDLTNAGFSAGSLLFVGDAYFKGAKYADEGYTLHKKSLASSDQLGQAGKIIAGEGSDVVFRNADRVASEYGGDAADWVKKTSYNYSAPDGIKFETHWVENLKTGQRVEQKTKILR
jgi:RHS repeat-associated protein